MAGFMKNAMSYLGMSDVVDDEDDYIEEDEEDQVIELVTTLRQNALKGLISKESPVGKAVMGRRAGERVLVEVSPDYSYYIQIRKVEKGADDESLPISTY